MPVGEHRFEVRAVTADGILSSPAVVPFVIAAPIWQRWWFLTLAAAFVAAIIYLIYRARLGRLIELERVRTRIATDLHDDIGANLTRISLLSEVASQQQNGGNGTMLRSIAEIARESVASMNDIVWAVSPEHDSLSDLMSRMRRHAEEVFASRAISLEFDAPSPDDDLKLSVGVRRDLLLIFKEAVNNAARHSSCSRVNIVFRLEDDGLVLTVADDGKGFETDDEFDGQGLRSIRRRAERLGGRISIRSMPGKGTVVDFAMPLTMAGRV
jgi:signal transduction histidine kinase